MILLLLLLTQQSEDSSFSCDDSETQAPSSCGYIIL